MNKPNKTKHIDTENRVEVTIGEGKGKVKCVKGINCVVANVN